MDKGTTYSNADDTLESILKKIQTSSDKVGVYLLFMATVRSTKARSLTEMNLYIQIKDPDLWEEIRKACYPTFFEEKKDVWVLAQHRFLIFEL